MQSKQSQVVMNRMARSLVVLRMIWCASGLSPVHHALMSLHSAICTTSVVACLNKCRDPLLFYSSTLPL